MFEPEQVHGHPFCLSQAGVSEGKLRYTGLTAKPSMLSVFNKSQASSKTKPPRAGKINLTAAEVRENTLLDNQEWVLKV